jgi:hypothetical protein
VGLTGLMVLLVVVALTAGLLGFSGTALSWPLLGIFTLSLLLLLTAALVAAAGGREFFD